MPEPFAEDDLVTSKTSIGARLSRPKLWYCMSHTCRPILEMAMTSFHKRIIFISYIGDKKQIGTLSRHYIPALKSAEVKSTDEKDQHREEHAHTYETSLAKKPHSSEELYNNNRRTCFPEIKVSYYINFGVVYIPCITLENPFNRVFFESAWRIFFISNDDTVAVMKKYRYPSRIGKFITLQQSLDKKLKHICNETIQKDREHPDDSGKLKNQSHRHKVSLPQKRDTKCGITEFEWTNLYARTAFEEYHLPQMYFDFCTMVEEPLPAGLPLHKLEWSDALQQADIKSRYGALAQNERSMGVHMLQKGSFLESRCR